MNRLFAWILSASDALLAAVAGLGIPLVVTTLVWLLSTGGAGDWAAAFQVAVAAWLLSVGAHIDVLLEIPGVTGTDPVAFQVAFMPLGLTAITVWLAWRTGARLRDDAWPWLSALVATATFSVLVWLTAELASQPAALMHPIVSGLTGAAVFAVPTVIGGRLWRSVPWSALANPLRITQVADYLDLARAALRASLLMLTGVVAGATLLLLIAIVFGLSSVFTVFQALQLDLGGAIGVGFAQLAVLPNLIAWAASWMFGAGFSIGEGSSVSPIGTNLGPLPLVPLFGAIPEGSNPLALIAVVLPIAAGTLGAIALRRAVPNEVDTVSRKVIASLGAAVLAALATTIIAALASGAIGPGRLDTVGVSAPWMLLFGVITLGFGALVGAFVPLPLALAGDTTDTDPDSKSRVDARRARLENEDAGDWPSTDANDLDEDHDPEFDDEDFDNEGLDEEETPAPSTTDAFDFDSLRAEALGEPGPARAARASTAANKPAHERANKPAKQPPKPAPDPRAFAFDDEPDIYADIDLDDDPFERGTR